MRDSVAEASDRCSKGHAGLLVKVTKTTDGALRMKSESVYCTGYPGPLSVWVEMYRDGKRTATARSEPKESR